MPNVFWCRFKVIWNKITNKNFTMSFWRHSKRTNQQLLNFQIFPRNLRKSMTYFWRQSMIQTNWRCNPTLTFNRSLMFIAENANFLFVLRHHERWYHRNTHGWVLFLSRSHNNRISMRKYLVENWLQFHRKCCRKSSKIYLIRNTLDTSWRCLIIHLWMQQMLANSEPWDTQIIVSNEKYFSSKIK